MSSTRRGNMKKLLVVVATLAAIGLGAPTASAAICDPILTSGENLTQVAANCPGSTTFTIKDGAYTLSGEVNADSGDTFKGVYSDRTRPKIHANGATTAFDIGGTNAVTISGLSVSGAGGGDWCEPGCGSAIRGEGTNLHVFNVRLHHNPNQGIGNPGDGFLLENSTIDHNGSYSFTGLDNHGKEPSSSAGVKILDAGTFRNNKIHDNFWNGLWCDQYGGPMIVTGNEIYDNGKAGIHFETCRGPGSKIKNNTVTHNGYIDQDVPSARGGIVLQNPQGVEVAYNTVRGNNGDGIRAVDTDHPAFDQRIFGVKIHHNYFRNDTLRGCEISGVECWANGG
jgi:parallel beta-helix repeat protein